MEESAIDLRQIFELLRRQMRLIIVTFVAVVLLAGFVIFSLTPVYSSSALILVDPSRKNLLAGDAQSIGGGSDSARIDSEVEILRSDNILLRVIEAENLLAEPGTIALSPAAQLLSFLRQEEPELPGSAQILNEALTDLRNAITVQRRGLTYLIAVQARSDDPEQAARLANAVVSAYIQDQLTFKVDSSLASRDLLQARLSQAQQAIVSAETAFDNFIESNIQQLADSPGGAAVTTIRQQIEQLGAARDRNTLLAARARASIANNNIPALVENLNSSAISELEQQRAELLARIEGSESGSAAAIDISQALESIDRRLLETANEEVSNLQASITQSQDQEDVLRTQLRSNVLISALSADTLTQLYGLQQSAALARQQYQALLSRIQDVETQADLQIADSRVVSAAIAPLSPTFPNKLLLIIAAATGALALGIGLAFVYDRLVGGFTTESQLLSVLRARSAVSVPRVRTRSEQESIADLMATSPLSMFPEAIRRIRIAVEQSVRNARGSSGSADGKVIVVASTAPNEGKTTIALALARSYALSGHTTLLIDCDLRSPSLHRHLGIEPSCGLLDFLGNEPNFLAIETDGELRAIANFDHVSPLTSIVGVRRSEAPTDQLLAGPSFARLIRAARKAFDFVVIDTPPLGPLVDGLYVAPFADAVVFVTRWASTSQTDAKRAIADITKSKPAEVDIIGVINQEDQGRGRYWRRHRGYFTEEGAAHI